MHPRYSEKFALILQKRKGLQMLDLSFTPSPEGIRPVFQPQIDEGGRNAEQKDRVPLEIVNSQRVSNQNVRNAKK